MLQLITISNVNFNNYQRKLFVELRFKNRDFRSGCLFMYGEESIIEHLTTSVASDDYWIRIICFHFMPTTHQIRQKEDTFYF